MLILATPICGALLLCSCVGPAKAPVAAPLPPAPLPTVPSPPAPADWHDNPATPGLWRWQRDGGTSIAAFGVEPGVLVSLTCDPSAGTVTMMRQGQAAAGSTMTIRTTSLSRVLPTSVAAGGSAAAVLPARDPLLDAMAYSRGRFAVEVAGLAPLYLPSWPEVARVIEDCR